VNKHANILYDISKKSEEIFTIYIEIFRYEYRENNGKFTKKVREKERERDRERIDAI